MESTNLSNLHVFTHEITLPQGKVTRLYCLGNAQLLGVKGVGFCGSRKVSDAGKSVAEDCAQQFAEANCNVVSGYALGVDMAAHKTALENGGTTTIVLPNGIDHFKIKKELKDVWDWNRVLVVSQFEPHEPWAVFRAMERNRVIVALSAAMIVIEAKETGGTFAAGQATLKAEKPLFVVDYKENESAGGNSILLQKGGIPLKKSSKTNRANLIKLFELLETHEKTTTHQLSLI